MRRLLVLATLLLALYTAPAAATTIGVEVFGGVGIPIAQDDNNTGGMFGLRVPVGIPVVTLEGFYQRTNGGETEQTFNGITTTRSGLEVTQFGVNALFGHPGGQGMTFFPYVGINSSSFDRIGTDSESELGFDFGLGLGFGFAESFYIDGRGEANVVTMGGTSRKWANINVGIGYNFNLGK